MELRLTNGTANLLTDLRVQNCVMLKGAPEFASLTKENKRFAPPFAAVRPATHPKGWIITAWEPCHRPWGNPKVPYLHSDPRFPDCEPGETQTVRGWLSFYEGDDCRTGAGKESRRHSFRSVERSISMQLTAPSRNHILDHLPAKLR